LKNVLGEIDGGVGGDGSGGGGVGLSEIIGRSLNNASAQLMEFTRHRP